MNSKLQEMRVDGGAVANNFLMNVQASVSDCKIIRPKVIETTAYGAALASAIGKGTITFDDITNLWKEDQTFVPETDEQDYFKKKYSDWSNTIKRLYL